MVRQLILCGEVGKSHAGHYCPGLIIVIGVLVPLCTHSALWKCRHTDSLDITRKGLHNYTHPRTDAVVIMIAIDETGDKVLLGRGVSLLHHACGLRLSIVCRNDTPANSTPLSLVLLSLVNHSRTLWREKCGKRRVSMSGM